MKTIIWHNPRCMKSRQTLELLHQNGKEPEIVEYLKSAPSIEEIKEVVKLLQVEPREIMRRSESVYKELELKNVTDDDALISAMANHPILIERPIVFYNGSAAIGRPPENVLTLF